MGQLEITKSLVRVSITAGEEWVLRDESWGSKPQCSWLFEKESRLATHQRQDRDRGQPDEHNHSLRPSGHHGQNFCPRHIPRPAPRPPLHQWTAISCKISRKRSPPAPLSHHSRSQVAVSFLLLSTAPRIRIISPLLQRSLRKKVGVRFVEGIAT